MNESQKQAAFTLLRRVNLYTAEERENRTRRLIHHCGWLVVAKPVGIKKAIVDLFDTRKAAEVASKAAHKSGVSDVQCIEASFTLDEYEMVMRD